MKINAVDLLGLLSIFLLISLFLVSRFCHSTASTGTKEDSGSTGFTYPQIEPCIEELSQIKPIPYRPFRWGDYHVTMGIRPMEWDSWIELDQEYFKYYQIRDYRVRSRGSRLVRTLGAQAGVVGSGHAAARELVYELAEYLSRRYPAVFVVTRHKPTECSEQGWDGLGLVHTITIVPLGRTFDLDVDDPMTVSALLIQDDLAIMIEGSDERYYLQAGAIVIPGTWRLEDKAGMPLDEIHMTGHVPLYREKLHLSLGRFFKRMPVDKPVARNNYTFQIVPPPTSGESNPEKLVDPEELAWAASMLGSEDHTPTQHAATGHFDWDSNSEPPLTPDMMNLRTERQTLRRLPKTKAIVFTIRTYITPVERLVKEPGVPGRMASAVRSWPSGVARYKGRDIFERALLEYLDEQHRQQIEQNFDRVEPKFPW